MHCMERKIMSSIVFSHMTLYLTNLVSIYLSMRIIVGVKRTHFDSQEEHRVEGGNFGQIWL